MAFEKLLATQQPSLGSYRGGGGESHTYPMLITTFWRSFPEGHREPGKEVGSLKTDRAPSEVWSRNLPIL